MPELIGLIKEYGRLMYEAGLREKEDDHQAVVNKAAELLDRIKRLFYGKNYKS